MVMVKASAQTSPVVLDARRSSPVPASGHGKSLDIYPSGKKVSDMTIDRPALSNKYAAGNVQLAFSGKGMENIAKGTVGRSPLR